MELLAPPYQGGVGGVDVSCYFMKLVLLKAMSDRLLGRGKVKMQVIGALMRKLVHLAFGILKSQKPFDPTYLLATP
jgi:hypothetical protein